LYQLKNRINELFFGILLLQEQVAQSRLVKQDLMVALKKAEAAISNGVAIRSSADVLKAEVLRVDQRILEMESASDSYRQTLGLFINDTITASTALQKPAFGDAVPGIDRPELRLFRTQKKAIEHNLGVLSASKKPRVDFFVQGGYGRPGLNMLENQFGFYYIGGLRLTWQVSGLYTFRNERQVLNLRSQMLDAQEQTFVFNTTIALNQHQEEIARLQRLMEVDDEIISLRTRVRETAAVQLAEGVITAADFVRELNAEDQAKQNRALHETQRLLAHAKYRFTSGQN
jgi:outer membrane protein TolC